MRYTPHDFKAGQHLYAEQLNEMDAQITCLSEDVYGEDQEVYVETPLTFYASGGIVRDASGKIDVGGSGVYKFICWAVGDFDKLRLKYTAYDSDAYYKAVDYIFSDDNNNVLLVLDNVYDAVTDVDIMVDVPDGATRVWVNTRFKVNGSDTAELSWVLDASGLTPTGEVVSNGIKQRMLDVEHTADQAINAARKVDKIIDLFQAGDVETKLQPFDGGGVAKNIDGKVAEGGSGVYKYYVYRLGNIDKMRIHTTSLDTDSYYSAPEYMFVDNDKNVILDGNRNNPTLTDVNEVVDVPSGATRLYVNTRIKVNGSDAQQLDWVAEVYSVVPSDNLIVAEKTVYVAPNGNDNNSGEQSSPLATVNKALEIGASAVVLMGGQYRQTIDLSKCVHSHLSVYPLVPDKAVQFIAPDCVLSSAETLVSGKVYSASITPVLTSSDYWIFQDGIDDESTFIPSNERHAMQKGYRCRCTDTAITVCEATTKAAAITEIQGADDYRYFYDASEKKIYFSRPSVVNAEHPICFGTGVKFFQNGSRKQRLSVSGVEVKYMEFNITNLTDAKITDCKVTNTKGYGNFVYDKSMNVTLLRCEAGRCYSGFNGDGINGHSTNTGDAFAKQTTATIIDCWVHDVRDDGFSDHERSESTIYGGLYEYNGKAGISPSYGSHCCCYNVYSRKNYGGFRISGKVEAAEGGVGSQLVCYGCIAESNRRGGTYTGFYAIDDGEMILTQCISIDNHTGYYADAATARIDMLDCRSLDDDRTVMGEGIIRKRASSIIS